MKNFTPLNGIFLATVLHAGIHPDREIPEGKKGSECNEVNYGFGFRVTAYDADGCLAGEAIGGGTHRQPLSHTSPARRFLKALQGEDVEKISSLSDSVGAHLIVEIRSEVIPGLGTHNVVKRFIPPREMSLEDWGRESARAALIGS